MIQARGLKADRKPGGLLPLLLLVSILCMFTGELAYDAVYPAEPEELSAAVLLQEEEQVLTGVQETAAAFELPVFDVAAGMQGPASVNGMTSLLWKEAFPQAFRTAVFLAGFLFVGKFPAPVIRKYLLAFPCREAPGHARFLRELFIQKKMDVKKRRVLPV